MLIPKNSKKKKLIDAIVGVVFWFIWITRNKKLFKKLKLSRKVLLK